MKSWLTALLNRAGQPQPDLALVSAKTELPSDGTDVTSSAVKTRIEELREKLDSVFLPPPIGKEITLIDLDRLNEVIAEFENIFERNHFPADQRHEALNTYKVRCVIPDKTRPACSWLYLETDEGVQFLRTLMKAGWDPEKITDTAMPTGMSPFSVQHSPFEVAIINVLPWNEPFDRQSSGVPTPKQIIAEYIVQSKGLEYWNDHYKPKLDLLTAKDQSSYLEIQKAPIVSPPCDLKLP